MNITLKEGNRLSPEKLNFLELNPKDLRST